jgi:hypothetical protein
MDRELDGASNDEFSVERARRLWIEEKEFIEAWLKQAKPTEGAQRTWRREDAYDRKVLSWR